ncbi:hypothetical protein GCM10023210_01960 [Chryseobacterium ginsengisoli]|uniref:Transposase n=1 Tax=Chryseobacterium ginsengisoli TaxID=363853 RepID=A0ABP9LUB3_9FLAO
MIIDNLTTPHHKILSFLIKIKSTVENNAVTKCMRKLTLGVKNNFFTNFRLAFYFM